MTQDISIGITQFHKTVYYLRRKKITILFCGLIFLLLYCVLYFVYPRSYESSAIIYNSNLTKKENANRSVQSEEESFLILNWVYSTELIDHLIKKFNLIEHYGFENLGDEKYARSFNKISESITTKNTEYGAVRLSVKDKDRFLSASIANEIVKQVNQLNNNLILNVRKNTIAENDNLFRELSLAVKDERDSINHLIKSLNETSYKYPENSNKIDGLLQSLQQTSYNYSKISGEWLSAKRSHLSSLKLIEKSGLPSHVILKYALPQPPRSFFSVSNITTCLLSFFSGMLFAILGLSFYQRYSQVIKFILTEPYYNEHENPRVYPINKSNVHLSEGEDLNYIKSTRKVSSTDN